MVENLYKILPITSVRPEWFGVATVEKSLENCRKNNDGTKVILKIPVGVKDINDVPDKWKQDFINSSPFMNHSQILI